MGYVLGIDAGGTFIDYFLIDDRGFYSSYKVLAQPGASDYGIISGLRELAEDMGLSLSHLLKHINLLVHGTTVATNAVLTHNGAATALLTTEGLIDLLEMRQGVRTDVYNNQRSSPAPLIERWLRIPVRERIDYKGQVIKPMDEGFTSQQLKSLAAMNIQSVAIVFAHSYINPVHEQKMAAFVQQYLPHVHISQSHQVLPQAHMYRRVSTTVLDAYVSPILAQYLTELLQQLTTLGFQGNMLIMQSNGGTVAVDQALQIPAMCLLSGPAAGPSMVKYLGEKAKIQDAIVMDMGGTSFDVSIVRGGIPGMRDDTRIDGHLLGIPVIDIHTIGAGGGSIAWLDSGNLLHVGPKSAGAKPGPVCYEMGGQNPTCTDADLVLGLINPAYFLGGRFSLNSAAARRAINERIAAPLKMDVVTAALGIYTMINTEMAAGIKEMTLEKGYDPREMVLVVGGGAGPIHAAYVAIELGITRLIILRESSVMCALGMLCCGYRRDYYQHHYCLAKNADRQVLKNIYHVMWAKAQENAHNAEQLVLTHQRVYMRYQGQHYELGVEISNIDEISATTLNRLFDNHHFHVYGYDLRDMATEREIVGLSIVVQGPSWRPPSIKPKKRDIEQHILKGSRLACFKEVGSFIEVPVYDGDAMPIGYKLFGPALVEQRHSTVVVPSGFVLYCQDDSNFIMEQLSDRFLSGKEMVIHW